MSSFLIFCLVNCFVQYAFTQRVNGPPVNNGLQYGPNPGLGGPGQQIGRISPELGPIGAPPMAQIGPNQQIGTYGQIKPNNQAYTNAGKTNQVYGTGVPNKRIVGTGTTNQYSANTGTPTTTYGGAGNGDVAVNGELPVKGMTNVKGNVPMTGKVAFNGNVACGGTVTISGSCGPRGSSAPSTNVKMPTYGNVANKPYGY
nr:chorion class CA protein ERA.5-like [Helicoverpa armigera]